MVLAKRARCSWHQPEGDDGWGVCGTKISLVARLFSSCRTTQANMPNCGGWLTQARRHARRRHPDRSPLPSSLRPRPAQGSFAASHGGPPSSTNGLTTWPGRNCAPRAPGPLSYWSPPKCRAWRETRRQRAVPEGKRKERRLGSRRADLHAPHNSWDQGTSSITIERKKRLF